MLRSILIAGFLTLTTLSACTDENGVTFAQRVHNRQVEAESQRRIQENAIMSIPLSDRQECVMQSQMAHASTPSIGLFGELDRIASANQVLATCLDMKYAKMHGL